MNHHNGIFIPPTMTTESVHNTLVAISLVPKESRIKAGAKFLDSEYPGWREKINKSSLDMHDWRDCILGQLFGRYNFGIAVLGLSRIDSMSYGFDDLSASAEFALTQFWLEELRETA